MKPRTVFNKLTSAADPSLDLIFLFFKRESDTRFSHSGFFHKSMSLRPLSIPIGPFQIFSEIRRDIRE
jgi:hypothetical protein